METANFSYYPTSPFNTMHTSKPVFLFAFANDENQSLRLSEEERSISELLAAAHDQGRIEVIQLGHATLEGVYKAFNRFHNRIAVFHYGGHSDEAFLNLEDANARSSALSTLIGQQQQLKLVFLNGCANQEQVKTLFDHHVKAVIATSCPIDDQRALHFSEQFYHALTHGKTIREAFATAKARVENDDATLKITCTRDASFVGVPGELFPWGLYAQDDSALDWVLPQPLSPSDNLDFVQEVTLQLPDVNKDLVRAAFAGMASCNPRFEALYQLYLQDPNSTFFNTLQNTLLDSFPSMVSVQLRDLFTPEGRSLGRVRLRELSEAYTTLARLLCAIAMANLWDAAAGAAKKFIIRPAYLEDIARYLKWSPVSGTPVDYFWLIRTISCIFQENAVVPYVSELVTLDAKMRDATAAYDAYRFLEQNLRQRLIANDITREEVEPLCQTAEQHLGILLQACAFLCNYQLVAVKRISVDLPRMDPSPTFIHQKAILKGRDYATIDMEPIRREGTSSNNSVFITRNVEEDGLPLNLSPFLIDQNAFKVKQQYLPKIYFFDGMKEEQLHFSHADTIDLDFVVSDAAHDPRYQNLDGLLTGLKLFRQHIGLTS